MPPELLAKKGFYESYLVPRMSAGASGDSASNGQDFARAASNRWVADPTTVSRVEGQTIRAIQGALKDYALARLGLDAWSLPLSTGGSRGGALGGEAGGMRLRLGVSHLTPRADLLVKARTGRVVLGADARGRIDVAFASASSRLRLGANLDAPKHRAALQLTIRL